MEEEGEFEEDGDLAAAADGAGRLTMLMGKARKRGGEGVRRSTIAQKGPLDEEASRSVGIYT